MADKETLKGKQSAGEWQIELTGSRLIGKSKRRRSLASCEIIALGEPVLNGKRVNSKGEEFPLFRTVLDHAFDDQAASKDRHLANMALIAQAGTVANRTGYWPLEMERRDEVLTRAMAELMAVILTEPISETVKFKKMAAIVQGCSDELRGISHGG